MRRRRTGSVVPPPIIWRVCRAGSSQWDLAPPPSVGLFPSQNAGSLSLGWVYYRELYRRMEPAPRLLARAALHCDRAARLLGAGLGSLRSHRYRYSCLLVLQAQNKLGTQKEAAVA